MANPNPETTLMTHGVVAYWDDSAETTTTWMNRVVYPSKEEAYAAAAQEARLAGAPGQALVIEEYDVSYMIDRVVIRWYTPLWSGQPGDIYGFDPRFAEGRLRPKIKISRRLGDLPQ